MLADAADMWQDVQLRIEDIRPAGERAAISLRAINVGTDFAEALEAVGLRE